MDVKELMKRLLVVNKSISDLLAECNYNINHNLDMIIYDNNNADECMLYNEFCSLFTHFDFISSLMVYLQKPIKEEGVITLTKRGRYKLNKICLKNNDVVEIWRYCEETDTHEWRPILVKENKCLEGQKARIRKK